MALVTREEARLAELGAEKEQVRDIDMVVCDFTLSFSCNTMSS